MKKKRADMEPSSYEIRVGMSSPYIVVLASSTHDFDPVQAFQTLAEAKAHFPTAKVSEAAKRKAEG